MPTRLVRDGIIDSRGVNSLSDSGEIFYRRLMSIVDDYGRFEADPELLRARCFPRQLDRWSPSRVSAALSECGVARLSDGMPLVLLYVGYGSDKKYLQINNFGQRLRKSPKGESVKSKYPDPSVADLRRVAPSNDGGAPPKSEAKTYAETESQSQSDASVELPPMQHEYPETLAVIREHDTGADAYFCVRIADAVARAVVGHPDASQWPPDKQRKAVSDRVIARACRESYATPGRAKNHGTGLLLNTVPNIVIGGTTNYA